jgi:hypothetical protein
MSKNSFNKTVVTLKFYCRTKSNFTYSGILKLFSRFDSNSSTIKNVSLKTKEQGNSVEFIKSFLLECNNKD